jgi:hypothetical protein
VANTILLKRSGTAGKVPVTANLSLGELSLNYTDGRLYTTSGAAIIDLSQNDKITLSGDATGTSTNPSAGSNYSNLAVTLSTVNSNTGTWGGANGQIPTFTVNSKGLITAAGNIALNTQAVTLASNTTNITANATVGTVGFDLTNTGVTAGNYGSATSIPTIVVDAKGRVTSITSNAVSTTISLGAGSGSGSVSGGGTLTVSGGTGITTSVTGSTYTITNGGVTGLSSSGAGNVTVSASTGAVTLSLPATGPGAVSAGSSTAIPVVTTDTYGRVTALTTAAVVAPAGTLSGSTLAAGVTASSLTSVGTLVNLTVTNPISGSVTGSAATATTAGTVTTAAQPNITSVGTLTGLTVSSTITGSVSGSAATVTGASQSSITTLAGVTSLGTAAVTTTAAGNFVVAGNLTVSGTYEYVNSTVTVLQDPIIELNTGVNGAALTGTAFDSGIKTHYWTGVADASSFFGRTNAAGSLEYFGYVSGESGNVITGTYGTIKSGALVLANSTASSSTTTGALQVAGGAGIAGAVYAGSLYDTGNRVLTTATSHANSGGDVTVSGAYNALSLTLATVNTNVGTFGNATYNQGLTVNGKGLITGVTTALITPAFSSLTGTPTTLSGYGITDALSTSATIDGGTY